MVIDSFFTKFAKGALNPKFLNNGMLKYTRIRKINVEAIYKRIKVMKSKFAMVPIRVRNS